MLNNSVKRNRGISLIEVLLVLVVLAVLTIEGWNYYKQYQWSKNLDQIQRSVDQLLQGASVYYYTTCSPTMPLLPETITIQEMQTTGGLVNPNIIYNPWSHDPFNNNTFTVALISGGTVTDSNGNSHPIYLIQVTGDFAKYPGDLSALGQIANLLGADQWNGGTQLTWTRLPSQALKHFSQSARSPSGWMPTISGTNNGGQSVSSVLSEMTSDLANFSKDEAAAAAAQKMGTGFTCPD